ncbi:MAG: prephenate dehydrogenase/arogenate dehydrogenase family protein, partial [bacterium]
MTTKNPKTIGIIGGTGAMGKWFAKFFKEQGYNVLISDVKTKLTNKELASKSDVVIFSVPIDKTESVIKEVAPFAKSGSLLTDLTSIKEAPIKAMLTAPKNIEVIGMHNIFGPTVPSIQGQTVVLCPARGKNWLPWLKNVLTKQGARIKITTAKKHDQAMGVVQALTHFTAITTGMVLKELNIDIKENLSFVSPVYRLSMDEVGRILAQNPNIYADIAILNPYGRKTIKAYLKVCEELFDAISKKDKEGFVKNFNAASKHLGDFPKRALEETNFLLGMLDGKTKD